VTTKPPCARCGLPEDAHPPDVAAFWENTTRLKAVRELPRWIAAWRRLDQVPELRARAALKRRDPLDLAAWTLVERSGTKLPGFVEARALLFCAARAAMPVADVATFLGWDRSTLHARERKAKAARAAWDAEREREAGERLALAAQDEAGLAEDDEPGHTCAAQPACRCLPEGADELERRTRQKKAAAADEVPF